MNLKNRVCVWPLTGSFDTLDEATSVPFIRRATFYTVFAEASMLIVFIPASSVKEMWNSSVS